MTLGETINTLSFNSQTRLAASKDITIKIKMRGQTPEAHAEAILAYFAFSQTDEANFKQRYGYDLRQQFIESYRAKDNRAAHRAIGNGVFEVIIPLSRSLVAQIKAVKYSSNAAGNSAQKSNNSAVDNTSSALQTLIAPRDATPQEKAFYQAVNTLRSELVNFGSRAVQAADVRADYLKTIKFASEEFIELVESGKISPEEGARRANQLRNVIVEMSRGKDSELGRAFAESLKKEGPTFEALIEKYASKRFNRTFTALSQAEKDAVFLDLVVAAGRDRSSVSRLAPMLGKAGKICLVASIAISIYNVATAEDKVDAVGREGSGILGGIAGGAAGGALAGLVCGPGAPICSAIGIFVGGAVGAFVATGGYDWIKSQF